MKRLTPKERAGDVVRQRFGGYVDDALEEAIASAIREAVTDERKACAGVLYFFANAHGVANYKQEAGLLRWAAEKLLKMRKLEEEQAKDEVT